MKKLMILLLAVALLAMGAMAETTEIPAPTPTPTPKPDFGEMFGADGYDGEWVTLPALDIEFCLPEGWHGAAFDELDEVRAFTGSNADETVKLNITLWDASDDGDYTGQTGEAFLKYLAESLWEDKTRLTKANGMEVALYRGEEEDRTDVLVLVPQPERVICFGFQCETPDAIEDDFALAIAGTMTEADIW